MRSDRPPNTRNHRRSVTPHSTLRLVVCLRDRSFSTPSSDGRTCSAGLLPSRSPEPEWCFSVRLLAEPAHQSSLPTDCSIVSSQVIGAPAPNRLSVPRARFLE
ncbi:MAG: hypothetical protein F4Z19_13005 [Holophagales bacterium]|nr:hypothetical protein [Holophagales bacterium]